MKRTIFVAVLCLAGCATHPATDTEAIQALIYAEPSAGAGTLIVKRDAGFTAAGCNVSVMLNKQLAGILRPKQQLILHPPAATEHIISVSTKCSRAVAEAAVTLAAGAEKSYRVSFGNEGDIFVQPTAY